MAVNLWYNVWRISSELRKKKSHCLIILRCFRYRLNIQLLCSYSPQIFDVHVNLLKHATVPHVLGTHPQGEDAIGRSERAPWINEEIIVVAKGHPFRTLWGIVKDFLCGQPTASGLRVVVQMNSIMEFPTIPLDYNGVVVARYFFFFEICLIAIDSRQQLRYQVT